MIEITRVKPMMKLVFLIQIWFDMASFEQQINARFT